jgi:hypothetical protein
MTGRVPACPPGDAAGLKELMYSSLERIGTLIPEHQRHTFYSIAFEILPRGSFNAYACYPSHQTAYILLDSGIVDFFGNFAALFAVLTDREGSSKELAEQRIIDYIWASALIYFSIVDDSEVTKRGFLDPETVGAAHAPKLHFAQIPKRLFGEAFQLSLGAVLFLVCHEISHILIDSQRHLPIPPVRDCARDLGTATEETMADEMAFNLMIGYAIRFPDMSKVFNLLRSVDFALASVELMQGAFPRSWSRHPDGAHAVVPHESPDHPPAYARRIAYRRALTARISEQDFALDDRFTVALSKYSMLIREGTQPSVEFRNATRISQRWGELKDLLT